ncbi:MAG TPA: 1,2-phenylacetyl-CoA epoxidase subunit PaaC [Marmoricola sp.]|nr:1,2-phenylacetyl-CoA epoxidase subunit PaaC [Marmoricola sp.]
MSHDMENTIDNAYGGLVEADSDARWAFGTGFDDPLAGLDVAVQAGVDPAALAAYCLMLGDDALVMAQRLAGWATRAPELEEEVALANVALDLLGQTRLLYARAAAADPAVVPALPDGSPVPPEDRLAFFRDPDEFRCVWLVQPPHGDFADAVLRIAVFATWRLAVLEELRGSVDPVLAAVAEKGIKELRYHRDYASRWVVVLAGGTEHSRRCVEDAVGDLWPLLPELGMVDEVTAGLVATGVAADPQRTAERLHHELELLLEDAGLAAPTSHVEAHPAGRTGRWGVHTRWLAPLLEELQGLARAHPMGRW